MIEYALLCATLAIESMSPVFSSARHYAVCQHNLFEDHQHVHR